MLTTNLVVGIQALVRVWDQTPNFLQSSLRLRTPLGSWTSFLTGRVGSLPTIFRNNDLHLSCVFGTHSQGQASATTWI